MNRQALVQPMHACMAAAVLVCTIRGKMRGVCATCELEGLEGECCCWCVTMCSKSWNGLPAAEANRRMLCSYSTSTSVRNLRQQQLLILSTRTTCTWHMGQTVLSLACCPGSVNMRWAVQSSGGTGTFMLWARAEYCYIRKELDEEVQHSGRGSQVGGPELSSAPVSLIAVGSAKDGNATQDECVEALSQADVVRSSYWPPAQL